MISRSGSSSTGSAFAFPKVDLITVAANLETILPRIAPTYVWAGACAAMPIPVQSVVVGCPVVVPEIMQAHCGIDAGRPRAARDLALGFEAW
jgi:hypothetical protein